MKTRKLSAVILMSVVLFCVSSAYAADYKTKITLSIAAAAPTYDETYTLTIPATLAVQNSGWNEIGSITVKHETAGTTFDPTKQLVITASSTNSFKLKANGVTDEISYFLATNANDKSGTTTFNFTAAEINAEGGTSKTIGVNVEDYSTKPAGEYEDEITYEVSVQGNANLVDAFTTGAQIVVACKLNGSDITASFTREENGFSSVTLNDATYTAAANGFSNNQDSSLVFFKNDLTCVDITFLGANNTYIITNEASNVLTLQSIKINNVEVPVTEQQS